MFKGTKRQNLLINLYVILTDLALLEILNNNNSQNRYI